MSWKHWCSSLGLCVLAGHVHALPPAQYDFTDLQIALVDLDSDDGIDPSIQWGNKVTHLAVHGADDQEFADWGEHAVSVDGGSATSTATALHGEMTPLGWYPYSDSWRRGDFTLSAHTQLVVTGLTTLSLEGRTPYDQVGQVGVFLALYSGPQSSVDQANLFLSGSVQTSQKRLISTFKNEAGAPVDGGVYMHAFALFVRTPAVPEPQAWLMAVCGLGLAGAVARRRRTATNNPAGGRTRT